MSFVSGEFSPADNMQEVVHISDFTNWAAKKAKEAKEAKKRLAREAKEAKKWAGKKAKEAAEAANAAKKKAKKAKKVEKKKPTKKPAKEDTDIADINKLIKQSKDLGDMFFEQNPSVAKGFYEAVIDMYEGYDGEEEGRKKRKGLINLFNEKGLTDRISDAEKKIKIIKGKLKEIEGGLAGYKLRI